MPMLTCAFAPQTRTAEAAVKAPRKNLRVVLSDTTRLLSRLLYQVVGWSLERMPPPARGPSSDSGGQRVPVIGSILDEFAWNHHKISPKWILGISPAAPNKAAPQRRLISVGAWS